MYIQKTVCSVCVATLLLSSCAAPGSGAPDNGNSNSNTAMRCAAFGAGGAILGALIAGKNGAVKGAIAGLAACTIVEVATRQTKTADEVNKQYQAANRGNLPTIAKIDAYDSVVIPNGVAKAGDAIKVQSTVRAVSGTNESISEIKEVLIAYAPNGEEFKRGEKKLNDAAGSGEYQNSFTLKLPDGAPQGIYKLETQLFLNGKPMWKKDSTLQVAQLDTAPRLAMLSK